MHLHWHSSIRHVSSGSNGIFTNTNGAKWCKIQIHAVKHGMFQSQELNINVLWWRHSWKMVKILRLQVGNKKSQVHKTCRQHAWNWLRMVEDVGHLGHIQPPGSRMLLRKPPVCNRAGLNFESSFPIAFARRSLGSAVIRSMLPFCQWSDLRRTIQLWRVKCPATSYHPTPVAPKKRMPTYLPTLLKKRNKIFV